MRDILFHGPDKFCLIVSALLALHLGVALLRPSAMPAALAAMAAPPLKLVRWLTPLGCPAWALSLIAIFWLLALRVIWQMQLGSWGLLPGQAAT